VDGESAFVCVAEVAGCGPVFGCGVGGRGGRLGGCGEGAGSRWGGPMCRGKGGLETWSVDARGEVAGALVECLHRLGEGLRGGYHGFKSLEGFGGKLLQLMLSC
jgi:hypothetical protein